MLNTRISDKATIVPIIGLAVVSLALTNAFMSISETSCDEGNLSEIKSNIASYVKTAVTIAKTFHTVK